MLVDSEPCSPWSLIPGVPGSVEVFEVKHAVCSSGSSPWQQGTGCCCLVSPWCLCMTCQESSLAQLKPSFQAFLYPQGLDAIENISISAFLAL